MKLFTFNTLNHLLVLIENQPKSKRNNLEILAEENNDDVSRFYVTLLNNANYFVRSDDVEFSLHGKGLWKYFDGSVRPGAQETDSTAHRKYDMAKAISYFPCAVVESTKQREDRDKSFTEYRGIL